MGLGAGKREWDEWKKTMTELGYEGAPEHLRLKVVELSGVQGSMFDSAGRV